ncbi:DUF3119 family protein [Synechococcales cyanobacterium C]|uniref:DUF3119 family protein n=1 Tax=Petrachloros mirabilis ULC683 TaxID=2781853 RepID=A0A8K2A8F6_9CYAN|nr:DUF3119 family protein [Petrachloros mirabilis]NCJ07060.1 DUF3119 family protein [Petrachloros mirabilis ULC683]
MKADLSALASETVVLSPSYGVPVGVAIAALPVLWLNPWAGLPLILFATFLAIQAATLRLHFTATALEIYRQSTQIRCFPYADWQYWQIYYPLVPVLFYFREVQSIHFLPILFNPVELKYCLSRALPPSL